MSESDDSLIEAEECLRKANSCDDSQDQMGVARTAQKLAPAGKHLRDRREQKQRWAGPSRTAPTMRCRRRSAALAGGRRLL